MIYSTAYLLSIVVINFGFVHAPIIHGWPPMSLAVGFVFVLRDFAQREIGHRVLWIMLVGAVLSYWMASPAVAAASCAAYLAGETVDWLVFTYSGKPLHQRVVISSLASTPIDSAVFLGLIGYLSAWGVLLMTVSKMLGALLVAEMLRRRKGAA